VSAGCPTCGEPLTPGKRFCRRRGTTLFDVTAAPVPASAPVRESAAERRTCSVLFCDVVGFMSLSEARDP
jgi:class 3 adenylate cyclase